MLESLLAALRKTPYADRIVCITPLYANAGEWNHWGYHEKAFVDYSKPMQNAFRTWLKKRYSSNEALQKTWGTPEITLESDTLVPPRAIRNSGTPPLRIGEKQAMWAADYYTFFNEYAADTIAWYGSIVKKASDRRLLYGTYYGYYFGHYNSGSYHFQDSGHYGVGKLLRSPDVDWYGGPYTYGDRLSHLECNGIVNSAALHGKLWMSEEDTRTHLSNEKQYGATANLNETLAVMKRNLMLNLQRGGSCYYHDFTKDWYSDPEVMSLISTFQKLEKTLCDFKSFTPEVAVIFSEEVVPHLIPARALGLWRSMMESAHRWNVPYDEYLLSDLDKIDFSKYKMVFFANTYCADKRILAKVKQNIAGGGRTLVFFYLPGVITPEGLVDLKQSEELTGIPITFTTEATPFSWVSAIKQKNYRYQHIAIPLTSVPDANCGAEMFGMLSSGTPAMAVKKNPDWTSVVIYHPMPDPVFMRDLFDMFKIHKYASGKSGLDDVLMRPPLYAVYSKIGGSKRVFLNKKADIVVELFSGQMIGRNLYGFDFEMERHLDCKVFFAGSLNEYLIIKNAMGN